MTLASTTRALPQGEIDALYDAIAHGDEAHRQWLREALDCFFAGEPVPAPYGKGA